MKQIPDRILLLIEKELDRAIEKFPEWPTDPIHAASVVAEESGELTKETNEFRYEPGKNSITDVRNEAVQTAAMAIRFLASMQEYIWDAPEQHKQKL